MCLLQSSQLWTMISELYVEDNFFAKTLSHPEGMLKGRCRQCGWQEEKKPRQAEAAQLSLGPTPAELRTHIFTDVKCKIFGTTMWKSREKSRSCWDDIGGKRLSWEYCTAGLRSSDQLDFESLLCQKEIWTSNKIPPTFRTTNFLQSYIWDMWMRFTDVCWADVKNCANKKFFIRCLLSWFCVFSS